MPCPSAPFAKLITSMDYRLKGSISLPVALCNTISLTTHLILGCNSPLRTITDKVVSWDCGGSGSAEPGSEISHLVRAHGNGRARRAGAGAGICPQLRVRAKPKRGRRISAKFCSYARAGILVSSRILLCLKGRGRSWVIPGNALLHRDALTAEGMSPAGDRSPARANQCKDFDVWRKQLLLFQASAQAPGCAQRPG